MLNWTLRALESQWWIVTSQKMASTTSWPVVQAPWQVSEYAAAQSNDCWLNYGRFL